MQKPGLEKARKREILTGFVLLWAVFTYLASLLLDFNFISPYATPEEDLNYLGNHLGNLKYSMYLWLLTAFSSLLILPFYLALFHQKLRFLHILNGLFILGASAGFLRMGISGLQLHAMLSELMTETMGQFGDEARIALLERFQDELFHRRIGSTFVGLFALGLGLSRIRIREIPFLPSILLCLAGPALIFLNWTQPEHLLRTLAMALIAIGVASVSVRLINRGLT